MADKAEKKIDPFDVEALEKSLNDSATRVSTIWVSFLIFSLYLLTAATTVTHRQLFLAEPVKLPVLNIDLPLWGFFFLAPILFVIFHTYVLLQVILLARTAAAYDDAVKKAVSRDRLSPDEELSLRQRLANTLFAQIFAGARREREGWFGGLLRAMAWITLVIAPILLLLTFQFMFLPYHSHLATWTHRILTLAEIAAAFLLWPLTLDNRREFEWPKIRSWSKRAVVLPWRLLKRRDNRRTEWLRQQGAPIAACLFFVFFSLSLATFPGEPHVNLATFHHWSSVQCDRLVHRYLYRIDLRFDRLFLPRIDVVDDDKLNKITEATVRRRLRDYEGERTRTFRSRDLNCAYMPFGDLRRVDLTGARLTGARIEDSDLQGASLASARLQGARLAGAQLQGASLDGAYLQGASLDGAQLQKVSARDAHLKGASLLEARLEGADLYAADLAQASLSQAHLQGASLSNAQLQAVNLIGANLAGASLWRAELQGASLTEAQLQGADLAGAKLQGALLNMAQLQGASLSGAQMQGSYLLGAGLQGASLGGANLQGALFDHAQLQGADLDGSLMTHARFNGVYVWRARIASCREAQVKRRNHGAIIEGGRSPTAATPDNITQFIEDSISGIPDGKHRERVRGTMRAGLLVGPAKDDTAAIQDLWGSCEENPAESSEKEFDQKHADFLRQLVCEEMQEGAAVAQGIIRNWLWIRSIPERRDFSVRLARGLLGLDGKDCEPVKELDEPTKSRLRAFVHSPRPRKQSTSNNAVFLGPTLR